MDQSSSALMQGFQGAEPPRGLDQVAESALFERRFTRLFRNLPSFEPRDGLLNQACPNHSRAH